MKLVRNHSGENGSDVLNRPFFDNIDRQFARFIERLSGATNPHLALAAALVSRSRGDGSICLDLRTAGGEEFFREPTPGAGPVALPEFDEWMVALRATPVVGSPEEFKPLVLDGRGRL
jgi:exodeoxyribonuclease V alpha subunit